MDSEMMDASNEDEVVILPATKEEESQYPARPKALSTVSTHPFARPDLQKFDLFKVWITGIHSIVV
jgi:hypothetical protein